MSDQVVTQVGEGEPVIRARRLSVWYGAVIGLNDVSLDLGQGVIGLLGPNGAGKSTFMKCVTGQIKARTGDVTILGEAVWNNAHVFGEIGLVPEQDAFYENMTGLEFVTYLTRLQGFSRKNAKALAEEAMARVDLTDKMNNPIKSYSKGMRQRTKIAQALAHKPRVLFMDEPLAGTDPMGRRKIIKLIKEIGDAGGTVVVSSHVLHEVEQMTRSIVLINRGRVLADGNVHKIRDMIDGHPHTITLICDRPRAFAAALVEHDDIARVEFIPNGLRLSTTDPDACYTRLPAMALERGFRLDRMSSPDDNLEAVFNYLVS